MKKAHDELPEDNAAMWTELEKRAARIEALEAALRFYADYERYDGGRVARTALDQSSPIPEKPGVNAV